VDAGPRFTCPHRRRDNVPGSAQECPQGTDVEKQLARARAREVTRRDLLAVVLTLTTGAVDAVSFLHLGKVFSSVITGNMALLGVAAGSHNGTLAVSGGVALIGYAIGVAVGGFIARVPAAGQLIWPRRVTVALTVEAGVLIAFSAGWLATGGRPAGVAQDTLLAVAATAMGMQSAAVRRLGSLSTTYLTSTLTGLVVALALRQRVGKEPRSLAILAAFIAGAVAGAVVASYAPGWVPAVVLIPIGTVLGASVVPRSG
jgi:uncharacterized membrane protein YoaK (UPF0700 family)